MGSADLVPGVSGGTIALVIGVYERLVASIRAGSRALGELVRGNPGGSLIHLRTVEWALLLPLLAGILTAVVILSSFLESQLEERPTTLAAAFFGLVLGSMLIAWRKVRRPRAGEWATAVVVAAVVFAGLGLGGSGTVDDPGPVAFFAAGALAICAMILPGISGSLILVLIGMYGSVLGAVTARDYLTVAVFVSGAVLGLAFFSQLLHWALARHHDLVLAAMVGLMAGSLRVVWPWPDGVDSAGLAAPGADWPSAMVALVVGLVSVFVIARLADAETGQAMVRRSAEPERR